MAVHGTMISSLPRVCHRAGTCRDSGGSTLSSRRLWRSMTADSKTSPLSLGTFRPKACRPWRSGSGRSGRRGTPSAPGALVSGGVAISVGLKRRASRSMGSVTFLGDQAVRSLVLEQVPGRSICGCSRVLLDFVASAPRGFLTPLAALFRPGVLLRALSLWFPLCCRIARWAGRPRPLR